LDKREQIYKEINEKISYFKKTSDINKGFTLKGRINSEIIGEYNFKKLSEDNAIPPQHYVNLYLKAHDPKEFELFYQRSKSYLTHLIRNAEKQLNNLIELLDDQKYARKYEKRNFMRYYVNYEKDAEAYYDKLNGNATEREFHKYQKKSDIQKFLESKDKVISLVKQELKPKKRSILNLFRKESAEKKEMREELIEERIEEGKDNLRRSKIYLKKVDDYLQAKGYSELNLSQEQMKLVHDYAFKEVTRIEFDRSQSKRNIWKLKKEHTQFFTKEYRSGEETPLTEEEFLPRGVTHEVAGQSTIDEVKEFIMKERKEKEIEGLQKILKKKNKRIQDFNNTSLPLKKRNPKKESELNLIEEIKNDEIELRKKQDSLL
jgi:hypothetical protein